MIITSGSPSPESIEVLKALRSAIAKGLDKKKRLSSAILRTLLEW
jgi:hypothetical protein